ILSSGLPGEPCGAAPGLDGFFELTGRDGSQKMTVADRVFASRSQRQVFRRGLTESFTGQTESARVFASLDVDRSEPVQRCCFASRLAQLARAACGFREQALRQVEVSLGSRDVSAQTRY